MATLLTFPTESTPQADACTRALLAVEAEFVPFSRSRNAGEKMPSLNYRVTLFRNGRAILGPIDYSMGSGHCPAYQTAVGLKSSIYNSDRIANECQTGTTVNYPKRAILPNPIDVIHSLLLDGSAIDSGTFEEWASEYGYNPDSRKGEAIYRACLEIGLKLRAGLGDALLAELREAFQDY